MSSAMLLKLIILFFLFSSTSMAQNTKPLIVTDNSSTCNATRMVVSSGTLACSGSVATVTTGGGGGGLWQLSPGNVGINTTNNVGIGTLIPQATLDVNGNLIIRGGSGGNIFGNGIQIDSNNVTGTNLNPVITMTTGYNVGIGTGNTLPQANLHVLGNTFLSQSPNFNNNELTFDANGSNFPAFYVPASGDSILKIGATAAKNTLPTASILSIDVDTNNVGIGTEIPASLLYVNGQLQTKTFKMATGASSGYVLTTNSVGIGTWAPSSGGGSGTNFWTNANVGIGTTVNVSIGTTSSTNTLTVKGDASFTGNVGIGTDLPQGPLQIKAATDQDGFFQGNQNLSDGIAFSSVNDANSANKGLELRGSTVQLSTIGNNPINFLTNDSGNLQTTIRMVIAGGGNVGIGTSIAPNILYVAGTAEMQGFKMNNNASGGYVLTSNTVGVGTWMPASGSTSFANPSATIGLSANNGSATTAMRSDGTPALGVTISPTWTGNHTFAPSSGNTLFTAGNIGIGTSTSVNGLLTVFGNVGISSSAPGAALDVNGTGRFLGTGNTILNPTSGNVGIGSSAPQALLDLGTTGTIVVHTTTGIGWSVKTGANTACNTTCGGSACVFGFDTGLGGSDVVNCASALADTCVCAGA